MISLIAMGLLGQRPAAQTRTWTVDGLSRTALVVIPERPQALVLAFHGHGGNGRQAMRSFAMERHWPEAAVVYPDGLPTKTGRDPEGKRSGWQQNLGENGDRDLAFVDIILKEVCSRYGISAARTFAMGHSNGGRMTYLLWAERSAEFAAFGPSASTNGRLRLTAKPAFIIAGQTDEVVPFAGQLRSMQAVLGVNGAKEREVPRATDGVRETRFGGLAPTVTYVTAGGHRFAAGSAERMMAFFRSVP
ncbi:MAG: hypothetical protein SFX74_13065 [Fimbriimonadaceae bacterium]|nr:hypothetical protein [Fimbriimonadaceae bacterium]